MAAVDTKYVVELRQTEPEPPHKCTVPAYWGQEKYIHGDVIRCTTCNVRWMYSSNDRLWTPLRPWHASYWQLYVQKLSNKEKK